jgi:hypothetical protein
MSNNTSVHNSHRSMLNKAVRVEPEGWEGVITKIIDERTFEVKRDGAAAKATVDLFDIRSAE